MSQTLNHKFDTTVTRLIKKEIGYKNAIVLHGSIDESDKGMDEASICGITHCNRIYEKTGINNFTINPKKLHGLVQ